MFVIGVLMIVGALVMAAAGVLGPAAARPGLIGGAIGLGLGGAVLAYLDAPSKGEKPPEGMQRAKATVLDAAGTTGSVAGYQMIELTLEVWPKGGTPFQVKRKISAGRLGGSVEPGRKLDVVYDPANPNHVELA